MLFSKKRDIWATATGSEAGYPTIYRNRQDLPVRYKAGTLQCAMRVVWPYDGSQNNGMPLGSTNEAQVGFEDAITRLTEGPSSFLMLVLTGNSRKE